MLLIWVSIIGIVFFSSMIILTINYSIFLWERKKVNDLTDKIEKNKNNFVKENTIYSKNSTTLISKIRNKTKNILSVNNETRKILDINEYKLPNWTLNLIQFLKNLRYAFWLQLKNVIKYLISLAKPHNYEEDNINLTKKKSEEVYKKIFKNQNSSELEDKIDFNNEDFKEVVIIDSQKTKNKKNEEEENENQIYQKLESEILDKLKKVGFNHFDIWLQLGQLYEDYNEKQKAKEIYIMIMKNTNNDKIKEQAKNKLLILD